MKKLIALLLLAAVLYLFLPLSPPAAKKSPKTLFLENLVSAVNLQDGRCEAELKLKIPAAFSVKLGTFDGKSTGLSLAMSSAFRKKSGLFAASLSIKPDPSDSGKPLTDLVIGNGRLYLNLRTLFDCILSSNGEKVNYSLLFPADYIFFGFNELVSLSPETVGVILIGLSLQKCASEPLSPLSKSVNTLLDESLFSSLDGSCVLTLDNKTFSGLAAALLEDIGNNAREYAKQLLAAAYPDAKDSAPDKSREALAAGIKGWSAKALSSLNTLQNMHSRISISRLGAEQNYVLSFFLADEKENLKIDCDMRLYEAAPEKITVPENAMNAEELFGTSDSSGTDF